MYTQQRYLKSSPISMISTMTIIWLLFTIIIISSLQTIHTAAINNGGGGGSQSSMMSTGSSEKFQSDSDIIDQMAKLSPNTSPFATSIRSNMV